MKSSFKFINSFGDDFILKYLLLVIKRKRYLELKNKYSKINDFLTNLLSTFLCKQIKVFFGIQKLFHHSNINHRKKAHVLIFSFVDSFLEGNLDILELYSNL